MAVELFIVVDAAFQKVYPVVPGSTLNISLHTSLDFQNLRVVMPSEILVGLYLSRLPRLSWSRLGYRKTSVVATLCTFRYSVENNQLSILV